MKYEQIHMDSFAISQRVSIGNYPRVTLKWAIYIYIIIAEVL